MGKHSICVIDICEYDMQHPELHKKRRNLNGDIIIQITKRRSCKSCMN